MTDFEKFIQESKGLIFDCDGTLVDSMPLHMKAWDHAFTAHNAVYDRHFLGKLNGMREIDIINKYNDAFNHALDPQKIVNDKHLFFREQLADLKSVEKIADIAKSNFGVKPMAVVSGSFAEIVHAELKVIGIHHYFQTIITADDPFKPKPDPECFLEAAQRIGIDPQDIVVFEDGDQGLIAAQNAGMKTIDVRQFMQYYGPDKNSFIMSK